MTDLKVLAQKIWNVAYEDSTFPVMLEKIESMVREAIQEVHADSPKSNRWWFNQGKSVAYGECKRIIDEEIKQLIDSRVQEVDRKL